MSFDPQKHHRRSIRLKGYDYTQPGGYFITIVTRHGDFLFGEIVKQAMVLSRFGLIADECWRAIPEHFPHVELGSHVIMPNHVHGIIVIHDRADAMASARTGTIVRARTEQFGKPVPGSIPTIIRSYKSAVTRQIGREHNLRGIWHRNYYERVIRNEAEWDRIHRYIEANPLNWQKDSQNPTAAGDPK